MTMSAYRVRADLLTTNVIFWVFIVVNLDTTIGNKAKKA